ncbi:ER membrane protein complex subunit 3 [Porphyridium purpureum]|uniref:ER membrane protein complex subunit 3 n=1 Tax=Porphyridium purpureum TaxID=35688 RepID=A0A5J4Z1Y5_PORPP|nr:ER membrane protein complex subunit 3 [Porphyridium purpureum]|eukprot:POR2104..scf295_1
MEMASMGSNDLVLDPAIAVWVLLPISVVTFLVMVIRHHLSVCLFKLPRVYYYRAKLVAHMQYFRALKFYGGLIPTEQFAMRRAFFIDPQDQRGYFFREVQTVSIASSFANPDALSGKVREMLAGSLPSMALGAWVRFFFGGFAVIKLPFPLSEAFRGMLQMGIEMTGRDLAVNYVSALSWYVLSLFGSSVLFRLLMFNSEAITDDSAEWYENIARSLSDQLSDSQELAIEKEIVAEREEFKFRSHTFQVPASEQFLLGLNPDSILGTDNNGLMITRGQQDWRSPRAQEPSSESPFYARNVNRAFQALQSNRVKMSDICGVEDEQEARAAAPFPPRILHVGAERAQASCLAACLLKAKNPALFEVQEKSAGRCRAQRCRAQVSVAAQSTETANLEGRAFSVID